MAGPMSYAKTLLTAAVLITAVSAGNLLHSHAVSANNGIHSRAASIAISSSLINKHIDSIRNARNMQTGSGFDNIVKLANKFSIDFPFRNSWSRWSEWSDCTADCGENGVQKRTRICNRPRLLLSDLSCTGPSVQKKSCTGIENCEVDGEWSDWSEWSKCSTSCDEGKKYRLRFCDSPAPADGGRECVGEDMEHKECNTHNLCTVDGEWSSWGEWSTCSASCGYGMMTRVRECSEPEPANGGRDCRGDDEESKECFIRRNCPVDGGWSAWGSWSECSKDCGGGSQTRMRYCDSPRPSWDGAACEGEDKSERSCNNNRCYGGY